ncbi:hypothetical protein T484DRAFT_1870294, partial [Baffinella frigidus]
EEAECNWAQCDGCQKWRRLGKGQEVNEKQSFFCLKVDEKQSFFCLKVDEKQSFFCLKVAKTCEEPEDVWDEDTELF